MRVPMGAARSSRLALRMVSSASMLGEVMALTGNRLRLCEARAVLVPPPFSHPLGG